MTTDAHGALIYTMVLFSAADTTMSDGELTELSTMVQFLPIFRDFDIGRMPALTRDCIELLKDERGLDRALATIRDALPAPLYETAYAIACDAIAADQEATQEELRLLEMLSDALALDPLVAAAIERGSRARHRTM